MNLLRVCLAQFGPKKINKITGRSFSASNSGSDSQGTKSSEIEVGQSCSVRRSFSVADVEQFAKLTGDYNPLHFDDQFARRFNFSKAIVHGALINGVISATIGTILPGPGSILAQQDLHFPNPLYVGEEFVTKVTIANKRRNIYFCKYECTTLEGEKKIVTGMAKIIFQQNFNSVK